MLVDLLKLAVAGRCSDRSRESLSMVLSSLGATNSLVGDMLLELCVTELEVCLQISALCLHIFFGTFFYLFILNKGCSNGYRTFEINASTYNSRKQSPVYRFVFFKSNVLFRYFSVKLHIIFVTYR